MKLWIYTIGRMATNDSEDLVFEATDDEGAAQSGTAKLKALRAELDQVRAERDEYLAQLQRERADSINLRKAEEERRNNIRSVILSDLILQLVPVYDSFDAAMKNKSTWESIDVNWRIGVEYIFSQLVRVFTEYGVTIVDPVGQPFDHTRYEAHEVRGSTDKSDGQVIIEVVQKGFEYNGQVLRPARVIIENQ